MKLKNIIPKLLAALLLLGQVSVGAMAAPAPSPSPSASPSTQSTASPSPSPAAASPSPSPSPSPAITSPSPSPSVSPSPSPSVSPTPSPSPTAPVAGPSPSNSPKPQYAFDDALRKWEPTILSSFSWDQPAGMWMSPFYTYDAVVGWYHVKPETNISSSINSLTRGSANPAGTLAAILGLPDPQNSNTGPGSINNASSNTGTQLLASLLNNASINNYDSQTAGSGAAGVTANTIGGNATSGAAAVVSNLLNLLNSMWTWSSGGFSSFIHNIWGNHTGDINLTTGAPTAGGGQLGSSACPSGVDNNLTTGPSSTNNATTNCKNNLSVNSQTTGSITNNVDMLASTGNATVADNTKGGDATSGDAHAELNLVNLINSAIGADQTFFGIINIFGNLNGDILFPTLNLNGAVISSQPAQSLAANTDTGPNSTNNATATTTNNAVLKNSNTAAFNNNVNTTAKTGSADVTQNTAAGSAISGQAKTSSSLFNLFDTSVFGDNAVLVLVNDMGHWIGKILNLPNSGGNAGALLTSNAVVTNNNTGPSSVNTAANNSTNTATLDNSNSGTITNNVKAAAISGNATVADNTTAGNARSGDATVSSNIANIFGSHLSIRHTFGILMINIFGSWFGSVGIDTAAGNTPTGGGRGSGAPVHSLATTLTVPTHAIIAAANYGTSTVNPSANLVGAASVATGGPATVVSASTTSPSDHTAAAHQTQSTGLMLVLAALSLLIAGALGSLDRRGRRQAG